MKRALPQDGDGGGEEELANPKRAKIEDSCLIPDELVLRILSSIISTELTESALLVSKLWHKLALHCFELAFKRMGWHTVLREGTASECVTENLINRYGTEFVPKAQAQNLLIRIIGAFNSSMDGTEESSLLILSILT